MKLSYIDLKKNQVRVSLADSFTIIDGRNGVGKSTIFDAPPLCQGSCPLLYFSLFFRWAG